MRQRKTDKVFPVVTEPVKYCECGAPIYDGRKHRCDACKAAMKKIAAKRTSTIEKYVYREELLAAIAELENAVRMQEWLLDESRKKLVDLKAVAFKIQ